MKKALLFGIVLSLLITHIFCAQPKYLSRDTRDKTGNTSLKVSTPAKEIHFPINFEIRIIESEGDTPSDMCAIMTPGAEICFISRFKLGILKDRLKSTKAKVTIDRENRVTHIF